MRFYSTLYRLSHCVEPLHSRLLSVSHLHTVQRPSHNMADTFLYFGYGSNLLRERILIRNPSAIFKTNARLDDYHLCFDAHSENWQGSTATIREKTGDHVWGVVWQISVSDLPSLDRQEGVDIGEYKPIDVTVAVPSGEELQCRSYQLLLTSDVKLPSPHYLSVIRRGAVQNQLPDDYQRRLAALPHNNHSGELEIMKSIEKLIEQFKDKN